MNRGCFADTLEKFGDRRALTVAPGHHISYREMCFLADAAVGRLAGQGGLLLLEMGNDVAAIALYVGALRARLPVILVEPGTYARSRWLAESFAPEHVWRYREGVLTPEHEEHGAVAGKVHPDLAVLLSTSGSTGSPKLVKLSRCNISSNADAIATYLGIDESRVAITNLPLHYSYGLSVLNSFLASGARVVLTDLSVVDPGFRELMDCESVTDLAGVPHTYQLLERVGFREAPPASLRVMTQAGGRLAPALVSTYARFARSRDVRFFVMYGQTEATARMAYLPPEFAELHPDCVGIAIPGGEFRIIANDGMTTIDGVGVPGELVYRGPNVMMGYALARSDLAQGPALEELRTGDIAQREPGGLLRIVGRTSRFSKIAGLRIGFDDVERLLRDAGGEGFVSGTDACIAVALTRGDPVEVTRRLAEATGLPARLFVVMEMPSPPTLASGKIDYEYIRTSGVAAFERATTRTPVHDDGAVAKIFREALSLPDVEPASSFSELGGDSLSYLGVSLELEAIMGRPPEGWEMMPVAELEQRVIAAATPAATVRLDSDALVRLWAMLLVFVGHSTFLPVSAWVKGGSGILFFLAGQSLARHQMPQLLEGRVAEVLHGTFTRLVLPYLALVTVVLVGSNAEKSPAWFFLGSVFFLDPDERGPMFSFWFLETLVHAILLTCLLTLLPPMRQALRERPFATSLALSVVAAALCQIGAREWPNGHGLNRTLDGWFYAFVLGWALHFAGSIRRRLFVASMAFTLAVLQFGLASSRPWWLFAAALFLAVWPELVTPRGLARLVVHASAATFFMYLLHAVVVHFAVYEFGPVLAPPALTVLVCAASALAGILYAGAWRALTVRVRAILRRS